MKIVALPKPVADLYRAIEQLDKSYEGRKFTLDGHALGSIGEVVAQEELGFRLLKMSEPGHDAICKTRGPVQIKITGGKSIAMRHTCNHLLVLRVLNAREAGIVYDGPGNRVWEAAGKLQSNGQRTISSKKLEALSIDAVSSSKQSK